MYLLPKASLTCFALVLAQQTVVNENAGELLADGLGTAEPRRREESTPPDRAQQHLAVADLARAAALTEFSTKESICPVARAAADLIHKVVQDLGAVLSVQDLGVELHSIEASFGPYPCAAATGQLSVWAIISKPGAACSI